MKLPLALILHGLPGSGKGAIAKNCEEYGFQVFTMSNILREKEAADKNFANKYPKLIQTLEKGDLAPDESVIEAFFWKFNFTKPNTGVVLDGCIRTAKQGREMMKVLLGKYCILFVHVNCSKETSLERTLVHRKEDHKKKGIAVRKDDTPEGVAKRQAIFYENFPGIYRMVESTGHMIHRVDGEQSKEVVVEQINKLCFC